MMTVGAQASSFVTISPPKDKVSSSIMVIGAPRQAVAAALPTPVKEASLEVPLAFPMPTPGKPSPDKVPLAFPMPEIGQALIQISPSIVAIASPESNIAYENVAAIKAETPVRKPARTKLMVMRAGIVGDSFASSGGTVSRPAAPAAPKKTATPKEPKRDDAPPPEEKVVEPPPPPPTMPRLTGVR